MKVYLCTLLPPLIMRTVQDDLLSHQQALDSNSNHMLKIRQVYFIRKKKPSNTFTPRCVQLISCSHTMASCLAQVLLTNFLSQHLEVGHALVFEQLNAVDTVKTIVFDHEERRVDAEPV